MSKVNFFLILAILLSLFFHIGILFLDNFLSSSFRTVSPKSITFGFFHLSQPGSAGQSAFETQYSSPKSDGHPSALESRREVPVFKEKATDVTGESSSGIDGLEEIMKNAFLANLAELKEYPRIARENGQEGIVTLEVCLSAEGKEEWIRIQSSSKWKILDAAAENLIRSILPYSHGLEKSWRFSVSIQYLLH